ncbi:hypothetical protein GOP47_0015355 [Adiantum capillus-veneris]|uniref:Uncharacterized protein n=1 Tax=Adiantum capillus-veneris TaxID=13818 RepID=A0A9D4ZBK9_ADICA|nr:hypothetical protein GOP47_0015355 [Adiantum capillus-veneris]
MPPRRLDLFGGCGFAPDGVVVLVVVAFSWWYCREEGFGSLEATFPFVGSLRHCGLAGHGVERRVGDGIWRCSVSELVGFLGGRLLFQWVGFGLACQPSVRRFFLVNGP